MNVVRIVTDDRQDFLERVPAEILWRCVWRDENTGVVGVRVVLGGLGGEQVLRCHIVLQSDVVWHGQEMGELNQQHGLCQQH